MVMGVIAREKVKGSGVWWVFVNRRGERVSKRVGSKKAAEQVARELEARLTLGESIDPKPKPVVPTLEQYYRRFERTYMQPALKETTRQSYEASFRLHILPELGEYRLDEISKEKMEEFVSKLVKKKVSRRKRKNGKSTEEEKTLSKDTIRLILAALRRLYNRAINHGIVTVNPATGLTKLYRQAPTRHEEIRPLSQQEAIAFLEACLKYALEYYAVFLCALHTGMRSGEIAALQWPDLDWDGQFFTVRRGLVRGRVTDTKTGRIRRVDISDSLLVALKDLELRRQEEWLAKGKNEIPDWIFCNQEGRPLDMYNLKRRHFKRCLRKAKLRVIRFHDLRHSYATLLIQQGESLAYVKDQLGHSTIKMTVDTYTHWIPGSNRQAVNQLPTLDGHDLHPIRTLAYPELGRV